jgi:O-antigen/teichoic acid export membrane protein
MAALAMVWWLRKRLDRIYPDLAITFRFKEWPEVSRESLPLGLAVFLGSVYIHGAILLLGWLDGAESAADFLVAQKLMLTMAILLQVINSSAFPTASRLLSHDRSGALDLLSSLLRYYLVIIIPATLLLALYANEVLALFFGAAYSNSGPVLIVLLAALPFLAISHSLAVLLRALPKPRAVLAGRAVSTMTLFLLAAILIPRYGATGAAAAVVASEAVGMVLLFFLVKWSIGAVPWSPNCFAPILAGVVMTMIFLATDSWPVYFGLPLAALVYIFAVWMMKGVTADELKSLPHVMLAVLGKENSGKNP